MSLAARLKYARKSRGFTQESLGNAIGVSRGVISNIEYNKTEPQALVLHAICQTLQINEHWLLTGKGQMETEQQQSARVLSEIIRLSKQLSAKEQEYILDMIHTFARHRIYMHDN